MLATKKTKVIMGVILGVKGLILLPTIMIHFAYFYFLILIDIVVIIMESLAGGDVSEYSSEAFSELVLSLFIVFVALLSTGKCVGMLFAKKRSTIAIHTCFAFVDEIILIGLSVYFYYVFSEVLDVVWEIFDMIPINGLIPVIGSAVCVILHIIALVTLRKSKAEKQEHIIGENILPEPELEENI